MRLGLLSDLHLDTMNYDGTGDARDPVVKLKAFVDHLRYAQSQYDGLIFTGDLADGHPKDDYFYILAGSFRKPIYFVLGNHDYYGATIDIGRERIRKHIAKFPHMHWLTESAPIELDEETCILGHDGMYDGRMGDGRQTKFAIQDFMASGISDFFVATAFGWHALFDRVQAEAQECTDTIHARLKQAVKKYKRIFIATHVPPFHEASYYRGRPSPAHSAPWFGNQCLGDMLLDFCGQHPDIEFTVLCGHTHARRDWYALDNLFVRCGKAKIGLVPEVQGPIEW